MLKNQHYDLILLDIMMAQMDGYQTLQKIRSQHELMDIPVVMISAVCDSAGIERCLELGANDYITKPFNAFTLKERILELLGERKRNNPLDEE